MTDDPTEDMTAVGYMINTPAARLRGLVEAVRPHLDELRERSEQAHYGYPVVEDPHDFDPDREVCTAEEIANHKAACEAWDRGERDVAPHACGNFAPRGWGMGAQTLRDPASASAVALLDLLLQDHRILALVEAAERYALATATLRHEGEDRFTAAQDEEWDAAYRAHSDIIEAMVKEHEHRLCAAADALHGESK